MCVCVCGGGWNDLLIFQYFNMVRVHSLSVEFKFVIF